MDVGNWISQMYVRLQWKYCIASAEISRAIPSALLMRLYDPLHETSYNNACEKLYRKFSFTGSQISAHLLINVLHGEPDMVIYKK